MRSRLNGFKNQFAGKDAGPFEGAKDRDHGICTGDIRSDHFEQGGSRRRGEERRGFPHKDNERERTDHVTDKTQLIT